MTPETLNLRIRTLLSIGRTLLGSVTLDLRGVVMRMEEGKVFFRFCYEEVDEVIEEFVDDLETEILADLFPDLQVECTAVTLPINQELPYDPSEEWVYIRREVLSDAGIWIFPPLLGDATANG